MEKFYSSKDFVEVGWWGDASTVGNINIDILYFFVTECKKFSTFFH